MQKFKANPRSGFLKKCLLVAAAALACVAQTANEYDSPSVNHIAGMLNCSCGCKLRMDCQMQPGCGVCKAAKLKILDLQKQGRDQQQIVNQFVAENGADVLAVPPGVFGTVGSYIALAVGLGIVVLAIRHYRKPKLAPADAINTDTDEALLNRYKGQIEKDLEKLD